MVDVVCVVTVVLVVEMESVVEVLTLSNVDVADVANTEVVTLEEVKGDSMLAVVVVPSIVILL